MEYYWFKPKCSLKQVARPILQNIT